jgi:hypothetical protein
MAAWKKWLNSQSFAGGAEPAAMPVEDVREQVRRALAGCEGPLAERMRWRIDAARTAQDLWLLRGEVFQLVAGAYCQAEAQERVNALLPAFEGWLPPKMLSRI